MAYTSLLCGHREGMQVHVDDVQALLRDEFPRRLQGAENNQCTKPNPSGPSSD
jgi:hypothetical protein